MSREEGTNEVPGVPPGRGHGGGGMEPGHVEPSVMRVICDSCRFATDMRFAARHQGHRREFFCRVGYGWVPGGVTRQCLYYEGKGKR